jgi:hypothetical protein
MNDHRTNSGSLKPISATAKIYCREIEDSDLNAVIDLLLRGFPARKRQYWVDGFARLAKHPTPSDSPKYGHVLVLGPTNQIVGVVLVISTSIPVDTNWVVRANISSWFVENAFRGHSSLLILHATRRRDVTYVNISAAKHTWRTVEAQKFLRYSNGQFVSVPQLSRAGDAEIVELDRRADIPFDSFERDLLISHSSYGCLSLWCKTSHGVLPFVFLPRLVKGIIPCFQLIYCRDITDYVRCAHPLGRHLMLRGRPFVILDANGPIPRLSGMYFENVAPKFFKGPHRPRLGNLAYTEAAIFGI